MADLQDIVWESLNGGEIYDVFCQKGLKLGTQANKMIRLLKESKHLPSGEENVLAKTKATRKLQRMNFENLSLTALKILRTSMRLFVTTTRSAPETVISESLKARALLLAYDHGSRQLLDCIFSDGSEELSTSVSIPEGLDDEERNTFLWTKLTEDYFNSTDWQPSADGLDVIEEVHPELAPSMHWEPYQLKQLFNSISTPFSSISEPVHYTPSTSSASVLSQSKYSHPSIQTNSIPPKKRIFAELSTSRNNGEVEEQIGLSTVEDNAREQLKSIVRCLPSSIPLQLSQLSPAVDDKIISMLSKHQAFTKLSRLEATIESDTFNSVLSKQEKEKVISAYKDLLFRLIDE